MKKLAIIGSGDLGQLIAHHALDSDFEIAGFFDDFSEETFVNGIPILGKSETIAEHFSKKVFSHLIIAIGYKHPDVRDNLFIKWKNTIPFANVIHSTSYLDPSVRLGEGIVVLPGCIIDKDVCLEDNVLLNTGVVIAHDTSVGRNTFIGPAVAVAGFVQIGSSCFIGVGTVIIDNIVITDRVQTGGGSVVTKSIEKSGLFVGLPARFVR